MKNYLKITGIILTIITMITLILLYKQSHIEKELMITNDYDTYYLKSSNINNSADIFKNAEFEGENIIAPGSTGKYYFNVGNDTDNPLKYKLLFKENNKYSIDIKYKLKMNNKDIIENWTSVKDLVFKEYRLDNAKYDVYELEWKWFDSYNDLKVSDDSSYNLYINIQSNGLKKGEK